MAQEDNSCTVPINHNNTAQETSKTILKNGLNKNTTECVTAANAVYHARLWVKDNPDVWENGSVSQKKKFSTSDVSAFSGLPKSHERKIRLIRKVVLLK